MTFLEKLEALKDKAIVNSFKAGEEANKTAKAITKEQKKKDKDEEKVRQLQQKAQKLRQQQEQNRAMSQKMGLGEKILRGYLAYKMASLLCHTLVDLTGGYGLRHQLADGMARGITDGIDRASENIADKIADNDQLRAEMIEQTRESFEAMSREAEEMGLTEPGNPLFNEEEKAKFTELAEISRDSFNPNQAELYAEKCADLGLDYNEALTAFKEDSLSREPEVIERTQEQESTLELEM